MGVVTNARIKSRSKAIVVKVAAESNYERREKRGGANLNFGAEFDWQVGCLLHNVTLLPLNTTRIIPMNFYFAAAKTLDRLDGKEGSIKGIIATLPEKDRKRTAALVIETLKCMLGLSLHLDLQSKHTIQSNPFLLKSSRKQTLSKRSGNCLPWILPLFLCTTSSWQKVYRLVTDP